MPGSTSGALFTGFLVGSALTASAAYVYLTTQNYVRARSKDDDDEDGQTTSSSRGLLTSSSAAAVVAHGEHVGFLTDMMANLWPYIKEAGAASIKESVEPELASLPGPLAKLHFTKVDLGTVPIRMDNVVMHKTDEKNNTLQFDLDVIWDGSKYSLPRNSQCCLESASFDNMPHPLPTLQTVTFNSRVDWVLHLVLNR
jgi:hypothetical protein